MFHLYEGQERAKRIEVRKARIVVTCGRSGLGRGRKKPSGVGKGNGVHLDLSHAYIGVFICENSLKCI